MFHFEAPLAHCSPGQVCVRVCALSKYLRLKAVSDTGGIIEALWSSLERVLSSSGAAPPGSDGSGSSWERRPAWLVRRGAAPRLGGHQGGPSPWFDPRGRPVSPVLPENCVGLGAARRRQLVETGAGLPVRSTTARAQPLAAAATQVCMAPRRGCEGQLHSLELFGARIKLTSSKP